MPSPKGTRQREGVSNVPGQVALIRIPRGAYSRAALREPEHAVFGRLVRGASGRQTSPPSEEQSTMAPLPCSRIYLTRLAQRQVQTSEKESRL